VRNLREVSPTFYSTCPKGDESLLPYLSVTMRAALQCFARTACDVLLCLGAVAFAGTALIELSVQAGSAACCRCWTGSARRNLNRSSCRSPR